MLLGNVQSGWGDESATLFVALLLAEYALGRYAVEPMMWVGAVLIGCGVVFFTFHDGDPFYPEDIPFALAVVGGPWAAGVAVQPAARARAVLAEANAELEEQARRGGPPRGRRRTRADRPRAARRRLPRDRGHRAAGTWRPEADRPDDDAVRRALDAIEETNTVGAQRHEAAAVVLRDAEDGSGPRRAAAVARAARPARRAGACLGPGGGPASVRRAADGAAGRGPVGVPDRAGGADQRHQARRAGGAGDRGSALRQPRPEPRRRSTPDTASNGNGAGLRWARSDRHPRARRRRRRPRGRRAGTRRVAGTRSRAAAPLLRYAPGDADEPRSCWPTTSRWSGPGCG